MQTRNIFQVIFFFFICIEAAAQEANPQLTLDLIFSGQLRQESPGELEWMQADDGFTKLDYTRRGTALKYYDIKKDAWSTLVGPEELVPTGAESPLFIEGYSWSSDGSQLLIFTNTKRVWRQNTRGDYLIFNMETRSLNQLGKGLTESSLMFAKFSPANNQVAYVSKSNLYVEELRTGDITQLTIDGTVDIINGTFDWAYEEEFFCRDGFRWSDDGKMIAYWQIDATDIKDFLMINSTDSLYPFTIPVQYPKVGQDPSSARIGVVGIDTKRTTWMKIQGDSKQHYLPRMQWIPGQSKLLVQQLNRKQNHLKIFECDANSGMSRLVYEEQDNAWIELGSNDLTSRGGMDDLTMLEFGQNK